MTRVEWTRLVGDDVEAVVAMLINRERLNSVRITPSRGDGGVDILDRDVEGSGLDVVYQVKRYTEPLNSTQKNEVERSLKRLLGPGDAEVERDSRWEGLRLKEWHLVTPWDPSPEAENWLHGLGTTYGVKTIWDGLTTVDQLAARYPDVIDYYLHGGRERIKQIQHEVVALFSLAQADAGLDVPMVIDRVQTALGTLDHDPHYRYEHRFGEGTLPTLGDRPGLVMSYVAGNRATDRWTVVDVIARCAASVQERPVTVQGAVQLEPGSEAEEGYLDFLTYGTPFRSPDGAFHGQIDAPGGLGGSLEGATIAIGGAAGGLGDNQELYFEVLDSSGEVLGAVNLHRVERTRGSGGQRAVLEEERQVFTLENWFNLDRTGRCTLRFGDVVGKPAAAIMPALVFVSHLHSPNVVRVSVRHTPPERGVIHADLGRLLDDQEARGHLDQVVVLVGMLAGFQQRSASVITVPRLVDMSPEEVQRWRFADALLRGEVVSGTYPEGHALFVQLEAEAEISDGDITIEMPLTIAVGTMTVELGKMWVELEGAHVVEKREIDGRTFHVFETAERCIRRKLVPEEE